MTANFYQDLAERDRAIARRFFFSFALLLNILAAALAASYGFSAWKDARAISGSEKLLEITVSGEGKAFAKPDIAKISATIVTESAALGEAEKADGEKSRAVVSFLKSAGIAEKDIKTAGYQILPQYRFPVPCFKPGPCPMDGETPRIAGYQIRDSIEITLRDAGRAGEIVSGAVKAGANEVGNISFTIENPEDLKSEARAQAIQNARDKGRALARALGKKIGRVTGFSESGGAVPPVFTSQMAPRGAGAAPDIQSGEHEIAVTVMVTYVFE